MCADKQHTHIPEHNVNGGEAAYLQEKNCPSPRSCFFSFARQKQCFEVKETGGERRGSFHSGLKKPTG